MSKRDNNKRKKIAKQRINKMRERIAKENAAPKFKTDSLGNIIELTGK